MAEIIITLTDERAAILADQDVTGYVTSFADHLIARAAEREKSTLIKVLVAKTPAELTAAAKPILDAERAKAEAEIEKEP